MLNKKGQFFSPDLIVATFLFVLGLVTFVIVSNFVFSQVNYFVYSTTINEISFSSIEHLISSKGYPVNWNTKNINEISFFGISKSSNVIDQNKLLSLIYYLDNNYSVTKEMLGFGKFDFKLKIIDFNGSVKYESLQDVSELNQFVYNRIVFLEGEQVILEGVVANEK